MGVLLLLWNLTNPVEIGPTGVFAVFVLLYIFWLGVAFAIVRLATYCFKKVYKKSVESKRFDGRVAYYIASVMAFIPVLIMAMQSVGQLELRDVLLVIIFASLAVFYILKRA
jgi:hypothetical protein